MAEKQKHNWAKLLDQLGSSSMYFRPKEGRTRVRLLLPPKEDPTKFYREVMTSYNGKIKPRYMVLALLFEGEGVTPEMATTPTPVILAKTILKGIISLLVEGYDLFGEEAHGMTIIRTGQGLNTDYSVMPSKNLVPVPEAIDWPEDSFDDMAQKFSEGSLEMDQQRQTGQLPAGGGRFPPVRGQGARNVLDDEDF